MTVVNNLTLCVPRPSSALNPHKPVLVASSLPSELPENHVLIEVDRFGFSANNVTYQALGEAPHFRYFDFHPAPEAGEVSPKTHGLIPVWGFGTVVKSSHPRIQSGERVYGYFSPTRYLLLPVSPSDVNKYSFYIPRPHLPADRRPYNQVIRCHADPQYDSSPLAEDLTMLYRPLFWTAFWCEDWLNAFDYRGARNILISSASAKTAFCLAYLIRKRRQSDSRRSCQIIGLTSKRNVAFTRDLKLYDVVVEYDQLTSSEVIKPSNGKWLYVDVAGNDELTAKVYAYFATSKSLVAGIQLGLTNLSPSAPSAASTKFTTNTSLSSPAPQSSADDKLVMEQFFMPEWLAVQRKRLRIDEITNMQAKAWRNLMAEGTGWVRIEQICGATAVVKAYREVAERGTDPTTGMIWSLWDRSGVEREIHPKL